MTYVIAEPCVDVMDQACVAVCPVDCIHFEEGVDRVVEALAEALELRVGEGGSGHRNRYTS